MLLVHFYKPELIWKYLKPRFCNLSISISPFFLTDLFLMNTETIWISKNFSFGMVTWSLKRVITFILILHSKNIFHLVTAANSTEFFWYMFSFLLKICEWISILWNDVTLVVLIIFWNRKNIIHCQQSYKCTFYLFKARLFKQVHCFV